MTAALGQRAQSLYATGAVASRGAANRADGFGRASQNQRTRVRSGGGDAAVVNRRNGIAAAPRSLQLLPLFPPGLKAIGAPRPACRERIWRGDLRLVRLTRFGWFRRCPRFADASNHLRRLCDRSNARSDDRRRLFRRPFSLLEDARAALSTALKLWTM